MHQLIISTNKIVIRSNPISSRNMEYHFNIDTRQQNTVRVTTEFWSVMSYQMEQINKWFKLLQTPHICYFYMMTLSYHTDKMWFLLDCFEG